MQNVVISVSAVFDRLKTAKKLLFDADLARALGVPPKKLAVWKVRNTVPYEEIIAYCRESDLNLEWVLTGGAESAGIGHSTKQVASGSGHVQVGGSNYGKLRGGVQQDGRRTGKDLDRIYKILEDYVSQKIIDEIKTRVANE